MNIFGKVFASLGHFAAWLIHSALPVAETVAKDAAAVAKSPLGTLIATAAGAQGIAIQAGIEAVAGQAVSAMDSIGSDLADIEQRLQAEGLHVIFDPKSAADIVSLYKLLKSQTVGLPAAGTPASASAPAA